MLDLEIVKSWCAEMGLSADVAVAILSASKEIAHHPELLTKLAHCHRELTVERKTWPGWKAVDNFDMFYPLVYIAAWPHMREIHRRHEVPLEITRATVADMELWMRLHLTKTKRWGLGEANWLSNHFTGKLYALGRVQFEMRKWNVPLRIYRCGNDVVVLAEHGQKFRADGQFADADGCVDENPWTAELIEKDGVVIGHPAVDGAVRREPITLRGYHLVMKPGDDNLSAHIPATGKLDDQACKNSIARAIEFFTQHFPNHNWRAIECISWLMDPQLAKLGENSNIVKFQRNFILAPLPNTGDWQTLERVFGGPVPIETAPRDTKLRRAVLEHIEAGGKWRIAVGMIVPPTPSRRV